VENKPATRSGQDSRQGGHPLAVCSSSSSLDGGIGSFYDVSNHAVKAEGGYHLGSAIRSTLPSANDYQTDSGMFSVNSMQTYNPNDPYMLPCRPAHSTSFASMPTAHLNDQIHKVAGQAIYYGSDSSLSANLPLRPPTINLGMSYPLVSSSIPLLEVSVPLVTKHLDFTPFV